MHFEFKSSSLDLIESFWQFEISEQNISVPFLLVGQTRDPAIAFDRSHVNFRSVLIGQISSVAIYIITTTNFDDNLYSQIIVAV